MRKEKWQYIDGSKGYYISDRGHVRHGGRLLDPYPNTRGYMQVRIFYLDGTMSKVFVHRLVAEHFVPNTSMLPEINHKDEDKYNNSAANLEWCTSKDNNNYGTKAARTKMNRKKHIGQYSIHGALLRVWNRRELKYHGYKTEYILSRCNASLRKAQIYKGSLWRYMEERHTEGFLAF